MISLITFLPLVAAFFILAAPAGEGRLARLLALGTALLDLFLVLILIHLWHATPSEGLDLQFVERHAWMPQLGVEYFVALDGLNVYPFLLAAILWPLVVLASWKTSGHTRLYFALVCVQFTGLFGAFSALNAIHWFLFWELSIVPAFFLIKIFGGPRRNEASLSFFLWTVLGSLLLLLGLQVLYFKTGEFDFVRLSALARAGQIEPLCGSLYGYAFAAVLAGVWVKAPLFPLNVWQPDAYTEAPTPVSMILAGLMSKLGVYGFFRVVFLIFPSALQRHATGLMALTAFTILLGAFAALRQTDIRRMLAYASLSHVAYSIFGGVACASMLDVGSWRFQDAAMQGALFQMFTHGLAIAGLFYLAGALADRTGTTFLNELGGLRQVMPRLSGTFALFAFSALGLPFLAGFVSELLLFSGSLFLAPVATVVVFIAVLTTAIFLLGCLQRTFTGPLAERWKALSDLSARDGLIVFPLVLLILWIGFAPQPWVRLALNGAQYAVSLYR